MNEAYDVAYCPPEIKPVKDITSHWRDGLSAVYDLATVAVKGKIWAEFGVGYGNSARQLLHRLGDEGKLFLFDSWKGIPTEWDLGCGMVNEVGCYRSPKPDIKDRRAVFVDGWFKDTLPFQFPEPLGLVHFDCDVYESTRDALWGIADYVQAGTVLIFDEIQGYKNYKNHEWRALNEWLKRFGWSASWFVKERFAAACRLSRVM